MITAPPRRLRIRKGPARTLIALLILSLLPVPAGADDDLTLAIAAFREGRYADAVPLLERVRERHGRVPQVELLYASSLRGLGRYTEAYSTLESVITNNPAIGELHVEAATSAYHLGRYQTAVEHADKALELGVPTEGEVRAIRATALAAMGEVKGAREELARAEALLEPGSRAAQTVRDWRTRLDQIALAQPADDRRWSLTLGAGAGFSSNAVQLGGGDDFLPGGVSRRDSPYFALRGTAWVDLVRTERGRLRLSYTPEYRRYSRALPVSYMTHPLELEGIYDATERLRLEGRLRLQRDNLLFKSRPFRNLVEPSATVQVNWSERTQSRFTITYGHHNFLLPGLIGAANPDSDRWRFMIQQPIYCTADGRVAIFPHVGLTENRSRGRDWTYSALDAGLAAVLRPSDCVTVSLGAYVSQVRYANRHSLTSFARKRRDGIFTGFGQLTYRFTPWLGVTLGAQYTRNRSNIRVFDASVWDVSVLPFLDLWALTQRKEATR